MRFTKSGQGEHELEDIYGLHFEKVGDNYQLAFSKGECENANWLKDGIATWVKKRNELQPDINDSDSTITDKKNDYIRWKARYPYNFAEEITNNFALVQKFNEDASSLLPSDRQPITRFSEFYLTLLSLEDAGIKFTLSVDEIMSRRSAAFYIDLDYILNIGDIFGGQVLNEWENAENNYLLFYWSRTAQRKSYFSLD